jgi:hypothetical protein
MAAIVKKFGGQFKSKNIWYLLNSALTLKPTLNLRTNGVKKNLAPKFWAYCRGV